MNPSDMTRAKLNLELAERLFPTAFDFWIPEGEEYVMYLIPTEVDTDKLYFDYNNWGDLMPSVVEHGIELLKDVWGNWIGSRNKVGIPLLVAKGKEPQRALAECLLLVLRNKGGGISGTTLAKSAIG